MTIKTHLTQALDVMPEETFSFRTTEANKTFGAGVPAHEGHRATLDGERGSWPGWPRELI
jgi:hypothetical protein